MTIPGPTRGEQTCQAIPQAAHDLFVFTCHHGTSMRQITREADMTLGAATDVRQDARQYFVDIYLYGILAATE
jgi:hypothetical protein